jgi:hypothetical protein
VISEKEVISQSQALTDMSLFLQPNRDALTNTMHRYAAWAASALIGWYLLIPPTPPAGDGNNLDSVSSAQAADAGPAKWVRFGVELKSRQDCESERRDLSGDPVVGAQMKQGRCVEGNSPAKP